jgi:hypothetical protein
MPAEVSVVIRGDTPRADSDVAGQASGGVRRVDDFRRILLLFQDSHKICLCVVVKMLLSFIDQDDRFYAQFFLGNESPEGNELADAIALPSNVDEVRRLHLQEHPKDTSIDINRNVKTLLPPSAPDLFLQGPVDTLYPSLLHAHVTARCHLRRALPARATKAK